MNEFDAKQDYSLRSAFTAARSGYTEEPSAAVENRLRVHFKRQHRRSQLLFWGGMAAAGIAAAILTFGAAFRPHHANSTRMPVVHTVTDTPPPAPLQEIVQVKPRGKRRVRTHRPVVPVKNTEAASEFMAIPYSEPLQATDQVEVYRVEMPRVTLAGFGLPVQPSNVNATVTADLAVGSDGIARAIRFIH